MPSIGDLSAATRHYVAPDRRHLALLHGNVLRKDEPERSGFMRALAADAGAADDEDVAVLLGDCAGWRERLTAAWVVAICGRARFRERIGELLLASTQAYAGQGYCLALAMLGGDQDAALLSAYLDKYLQRPDLYYDQAWAMSAVAHIDDTRSTAHAQQFLRPDGLWHRWAVAHAAVSLDKRRGHLNELAALCARFASLGTTDSGERDVAEDRLPPGWLMMPADTGARFDDELRREVGERHILWGASTTAVARCESCDDVLFRINGRPTRWAIVHLTWSRKTEPTAWPAWRLFASPETALAGLTKPIH